MPGASEVIGIWSNFQQFNVTDLLQQGADGRHPVGSSSLQFEQGLRAADEYLRLAVLHVFAGPALVDNQLRAVLVRSVPEVGPCRLADHLVSAHSVGRNEKLTQSAITTGDGSLRGRVRSCSGYCTFFTLGFGFRLVLGKTWFLVRFVLAGFGFSPISNYKMDAAWLLLVLRLLSVLV